MTRIFCSSKNCRSFGEVSSRRSSSRESTRRVPVARKSASLYPGWQTNSHVPSGRQARVCRSRQLPELPTVLSRLRASLLSSLVPITMLGEQLIKNERIALIELIKNAYDADAGWVRISFNNFGDSFEITPESEIIVEDDGHGMTADVIEKHWLNPATPEKKRRKQTHPTTLKGRVIQGDKGIGRFAILKLGRVIEVVSRAESENVEHVVNYNFSKYDDDFLSEEGVDKELYIDDLTISLTSRQPEIILSRPITLGVQRLIRNPKGTRITITDLKGSWSKQKVDMVYRDVSRLESIFSSGTNLACETNDKIHQTDKGSFDVWIYKDGELQLYHERYIEQLHRLLNERSVFRVENGIYDESMCEFRFSLNGVPKVLKLTDPEVTGLWAFKTYFKKKTEKTFSTPERQNAAPSALVFSFSISVQRLRQNTSLTRKTKQSSEITEFTCIAMGFEFTRTANPMMTGCALIWIGGLSVLPTS